MTYVPEKWTQPVERWIGGNPADVRFVYCAEASDGQPIRSCDECGAVVHAEDQSRHQRWHGRIDEYLSRLAEGRD